MRTFYWRAISDAKKFFRAVNNGGFLAALRYLCHVLIWRFHAFIDRNYDRDYNVETSSHAFSKDLTFRSEGDDIGFEEPMYLPTSSLAFSNIMSSLPIRARDFVFVDFGSGKGRTLFLASDYDFKRIIGVEFAQELHDIAARNIDTYQSASQRCFTIASQLVDATVFDVPDGPCMFYFFNPFEQVVLRKVTARIAESYRRTPRKMYFIYYKPKFPDILAMQDFLVKAKTKRRFAAPKPYGLLIYETPDP